MSLPRYPEYKNSGVAWLGEVPGHWEVMPFYSVAAEREEPNIGMQEDNLLSLSYGRIIQKDISSNDGLLPESFETYQIIRPGDIVFRLTDLQNDKRSLRTAIVEETGIITSAYVAAQPIKIEPRYLNYLLRAYDVTKVFYSMGGGLRQSMKFAELKRLPTLIPSLEEQQTIAAFLDRETGKIDVLIAEQQRLVELLAEKRQAVISHAVTKGLNPNAKMKDSGIEWLGEVPEHWEVKKVKFLLARDGYKAGPFGSSLITSELSEEGSILVLTPEHIANESLDLPFNQYLDESRREEMAAFFVDKNDIVFPIVGTLGRAMIIPSSRPGILNQRLARMTADIAKLQPAYLKLILTDVDFYKKLDEIESKGAILNHITKEKLINRPVLLPPLKEQEEIISFLDSETAKFDTLTAEANRAIELLKERRSALISAAVTGKIDVRTFVSSSQAGEGKSLEAA